MDQRRSIMRTTLASLFPAISITSWFWTSCGNQNAYHSDKCMLIRKSLPTWLIRQSNGLLYAYGTRVFYPDVSTLQSRVLYKLHGAPTTGHHGITRILATL
jgi:hypothetical protein